MKVIAHISDLHFGTEDAGAAESLDRDLKAIVPSLLVVSGDLTQRGRRRQFEAAHEYLRRLPTPQLVIPGNHDIPLFDVVRRFASPLTRYCRHISEELNPCYRDDQLVVLGLNTARSLTWKNGRISLDQIRLAKETFEPVGSSRFKILVTHHPFIPPPGQPEGAIQLVGRAKAALKILDDTGVDMLLAGHLHHGYQADVRTHYPTTKRSMIVVQAGTAISNRLRHEPNAYNLLTIDGDQIRISVRTRIRGEFTESQAIQYRLRHREWIPEK
jgi:3',5'-cyclic AMP phosphodiesterase CpdA